MANLRLNSQADKPSALNVGRAAQVLRGLNQQPFTMTAEAIEQIQREVQRIGKAVASAPSLDHLSIDSADITELSVGGVDDPGIFEIFSGPPSYTRIGFDGTETTAITATISLVSGATVTFTAAHPFQVEDIILIEGSTSLNHLGYWIVAGITSTTVTLTNPPIGTGTGGTATFQYAGGWRRTFAIGGDGFDTAPFFCDSLGQANIGKNGSINLLDANGIAKGFLGVVTEVEKNVTGAVNNGSGLVRLTVVAHGCSTGDDVYSHSIGGVTGANGDFAVTVVDADNIDLQGSTFSGAYTSGGKIYRYRGPFWGQAIAAGATGYDDATFRTFRNGSMRLGDPAGPRMEYDADLGEMGLTDASLSIVDGDVEITIDGVSGVKVKDIPSGDFAQMRDGEVIVRSNASLGPRSAMGLNYLLITGGSASHRRVETRLDDPITWEIYNDDGVSGQLKASVSIPASGAGGHANFPSLRIGGVTVIDSAWNGFFNNIYTMSQVDTLVAGLQAQINNKSAIGHTHTGTIGSTSITVPSTPNTQSHAHPVTVNPSIS